MKQRESETDLGRRSGTTAGYQLPSYLTAIPAPSGGHASLRAPVAVASSPPHHTPSPPAPAQPALSAMEATSPTFSFMDYYANTASSLSSPAKPKALLQNHSSHHNNSSTNSRPSLEKMASLGMSPTSASAFSSHFSRPYISGSQWGAGARFADSDSDDENDESGSESEDDEEEPEQNEGGGNHPHTQLELGERDTAQTSAGARIHHINHIANNGRATREGRRLDVVDDSRRASLEPKLRSLPRPTHSLTMPQSPAAASSSVQINQNSSDDEAPLGVVAAQFKQNQQATKSPATIRANSLETPPAILPSEQTSFSNLLNTLAASGKSAGDLDNLEGLVGALNDLIVKKRKEEQQQQQQQSNAISKLQPARQQTYPPLKASAPESDSEDDDKPLAQIQKAALEETPSTKPFVRATTVSHTAMSRTTNKSTAPSLKPKNPLQETQPRPQQRTNPNIPQAPTPTPVEPAPSKKITIRIYLDVPHLASPYKTVILTNQLTADMVVDQLLALLEAGGSGFVDNGTWTLFEVCADFGVERPLRDWEVVTDVVEAWLDGNGGLLPGGKGGVGEDGNRLWLKSYGFRNTLVPRCIIGKWPKVEGRFDVEIKPGKWKRRYFILREDVIYYKERESDVRENILCKLNNFDVYTLLQARKRAPTRYCFALRSTASLTVFEKADEYAHYFCVENQTQMVDWVLGIRLAKNECMFTEYPDMFADYDNVPARSQPRLKPAVVSAAITSQVQQQQQSLTKEIVSAAAAAAADQEPFIPATSLLGQSLAKKKEPLPAIAPPQSGKPLLSFQTTNLQLFSNSADFARTKSKRASNGTPSSATTPNVPKRDFFNNEPATALLDQITEAADMWRPGATPVDNSRPYDDAYVQDVLARLDRAWEIEQQQVTALVDATRDGGALPGTGEEIAARQGPKRDSAPPLVRSKSIGVPSGHARRTSVEAATAAGGGSATLGRSVGKPLIDVSDSKNCLTCGCSEFKSVYTHAGGVLNRDGKRVCGNCRHAHK